MKVVKNGHIAVAEILAAAREHMLGGREPQCHRDWQMVMNFLAANIRRSCAQAACKLIARLYDIPLSDPEIEEIVAVQLARKE